MKVREITQADFRRIVSEAYSTGDVAALREMARDMGIRDARSASPEQLKRRLSRTRLAAYLGYAAFWSFLPFGAVFGIVRKHSQNQASARLYVGNLDR